MENNENYNHEPRMFSGEGIREGFILKPAYIKKDQKLILRLTDTPNLLNWGIESLVTNWMGYYYKNLFQEFGKEISEADLIRYLGEKEIQDMIITTKYQELKEIHLLKEMQEELENCATKDDVSFVINYWKNEAEKYKRLYFEKMGINPKKETPKKSKKKSLIQRILSLPN
jgi:hypothetical protein